MITRIPTRTAEIMPGQPVKRALPNRNCPRIGAWCFLDYLHIKSVDPKNLNDPSKKINVAPHPHIGLQTFTWMLQGEIVHHDSLGNHSIIRPYEVNLMTAGNGIVHTEVSEPNYHGPLKTLQFWIALPKEKSSNPSSFKHYDDLPMFSHEGLIIHLFMGRFLGYRAPTQSYSPLMGADIMAHESKTCTLPLDPEFEYGIFITEGAVEIDGEHYNDDEFIAIETGQISLTLTLEKGTHIALIGGTPLTEPLIIWWNFVAHDPAQIEAATRDWGNYPNKRFNHVKHPDSPLNAPALNTRLKAR
ncbi:MAG: pirin family protein [Xanthomonadaceae bacterium]|nr:pirin family protein [Xanthomonadaceae bacterium]